MAVRAMASPTSPSGPGSPEDDDRALMRLVAQGDREALGVLYDRHGPVLLAVAGRALGEVREAQDLVQDVLLEAWLHAGEFDPDRGSARGWLLLRLRSRALDRLRRAGARPTTRLDGEATLDRAPPDGVSLDVVDRLGVRQAVAALDADVREILERTYFRELTAEQVARETGLPVGTVRSRLARGLRVLRDALDGSAPEPQLQPRSRP
jgi:RNA polymerase sigma-70 factor (ECF subfamily)